MTALLHDIRYALRLATTLLVAYIPGGCAAKVDPMVALRCD